MLLIAIIIAFYRIYAHAGVPMVVCPWWCAHGSAPMALCCFVGCCLVYCSPASGIAHAGAPMIVCRSPASRHHPCRCAHDRMLLGVLFPCFQTSPMQVLPWKCAHGSAPMIVCCLVYCSPASGITHAGVPMVVCPWWCVA